MTQFSITEQQIMTKGLSPEQRMLFNSQLSSSKKDRDTVLILSVILGYWGVDRFYVGDMGMGLLKLFTFGGCGIFVADRYLHHSRPRRRLQSRQGQEILAGVRMMSA